MIFFCDGSGYNGKESKICVCDEEGNSHISRFPVKHTNNEMEYEAVIFALNLCNECDTVKTDSKLVVEQVKGRWKVTKRHLLPLMLKARKLMNEKKVTIEWIPRNENLAGNLLE